MSPCAEEWTLEQEEWVFVPRMDLEAGRMGLCAEEWTLEQEEWTFVQKNGP